MAKKMILNYLHPNTDPRYFDDKKYLHHYSLYKYTILPPTLKIFRPSAPSVNPALAMF